MKKTTWIIFGVFILVLAAFFLLQNIEIDTTEEDTGPTSTSVPSLRSFDDQDLVAINYEESGEVVIQLEKVDTLEWTVTTHPEGQVTAGNVEEILSYLSELDLLSTLSSSSSVSLEEVGLDEPGMALVLEYEDGSTYTISLGATTTLDDGYYALVDDYEAVVLLPLDTIDSVISLMDEATIPPTATPTPTTESTETPEATESVEENTPTPTPEDTD